MPFAVVLLYMGLTAGSASPAPQLPDEPQPSVSLPAEARDASLSSSNDPAGFDGLTFDQSSGQSPVQGSAQGSGQAGQTTGSPSPDQADTHSKPADPADPTGNAVPLERRQPQRILGFMPNFRSVSGGTTPHPPGWKYNFKIATRQATDYSSFIFLGITSLTAEGTNEHPALGKGIGGFYAYTWRGFLDKSDGTYLSAWLLPSLLHEDTRFYALGSGHKIAIRALYVISRQAVARTYSGKQTPNIAGLGGKVLTQVVSRTYYPSSATSFGTLATKFGYSVMRDIAFSSIREFYPDVAAHYIRKHREKVAREAATETAAP